MSAQKKRKSRMRDLLKRLASPKVTAVLAFAVIIGIVLFVSSRQNEILEDVVINQLKQQQSQLVYQLAGRVEESVRVVLAKLEMFSRIQLTSRVPEEARFIYSSNESIVSSIVVFDDGGQIVAAVPEAAGELEAMPSEIPKRQQVLDVRTHPEPYVVVLTPRPKAAGGGVVVARLNLTCLARETIETARAGNHSFVWLVDNAGAGVGSMVENESLAGKNLLEIAREYGLTDAERILTDMIAGGSGFEEVEWLGGLHFIAYQPVEIADDAWAVGVILPREVIVGELEIVSDTTFILTVLVLSLIFISAVGWAYVYIKRGEILEVKVRNRTRQLGEINVKLRKRSDDLRNSMTERQKKTLALENSNKELEAARIATMNMLEDLNEAMKGMHSLEELDRLKDEFLSIVSHELKTPITPMVGQLQMLLASRWGKLNPKQQDSLNMILRNTERLNRLVRDVLDISRISSGRLRLELQNEQISGIISDAVGNIKDHAKTKGVRLVAKRIPPMPEIVIDRFRIVQVLTNLIDNAVKFTPEGGQVTLSAKASKKLGEILVCVEDSGIGIPRKDMNRIFKPFYQVETAASRRHEGTGLGLAICKGIMEMHGGRIWVESVEGQGSKFYFALPIKGIESQKKKEQGTGTKDRASGSKVNRRAKGFTEKTFVKTRSKVTVGKNEKAGKKKTPSGRGTRGGKKKPKRKK